MKRPIFVNTALVLGSILVALLIMEVFLRLFMPQIFEVSPGMYVADPEVGYVLDPGFEGVLERSEFKTRFTIGASGLRGADPRPRRPNTVRILVLGDSQTWGFGITDEETFAARLEALLATHYADLDIQVLNGGVPGYGTADQLAFLQSRGAWLQPDLVIVQFLSVNDLLENRHPAQTSITVVDGRLAWKEGTESADEQPSFMQKLLKIKHWLKRNSHVAALLFDGLGYLGTRFGWLGQVDALWGEDFTTEDANLGTDLLVQIAQTADVLDATTLLVYTTGQAQVIQNIYAQPRSATVVERAAQQASVPWIDASHHMQQRSDRNALYYRKNGHWTSSGHQVVAEILADEIRKLNLIDPAKRPEVQAR